MEQQGIGLGFRNRPTAYCNRNILQVLNMPKEKNHLLTGIDEEWFEERYVSVVSGLRGSCKVYMAVRSEFLMPVDAGNNVACFSGELSEKNFMRWMNLQAAGKSRVEA